MLERSCPTSLNNSVKSTNPFVAFCFTGLKLFKLSIEYLNVFKDFLDAPTADPPASKGAIIVNMLTVEVLTKSDTTSTGLYQLTLLLFSPSPNSLSLTPLWATYKAGSSYGILLPALTILF